MASPAKPMGPAPVKSAFAHKAVARPKVETKNGRVLKVWATGYSGDSIRLASLTPMPSRADGPDLEVMARYCHTHVPTLLEKAQAWCIDQGQLRRHAERIRTLSTPPAPAA